MEKIRGGGSGVMGVFLRYVKITGFFTNVMFIHKLSVNYRDSRNTYDFENVFEVEWCDEKIDHEKLLHFIFMLIFQFKIH